MSWTKIIKCDLCNNPPHEFFGNVTNERTFIGINLGWFTVQFGRSVYDICPECMEGTSPEDVKAFLREHPPTPTKTFRELIQGCFVKGWNESNKNRK